MSCPRCGATVPAQARFCAACGMPLDGDPASMATLEERTVAPTAVGETIAEAVVRPSSPSGYKSSSSGWLTSSDSISHGRFPPGAILDGRYHIIGLLGRGGMGEVYRADDLRLGQPVALKFLPDTVSRDAVLLAQFHNEVRTARQVAHPNVCRVYDIGEVDGHLFLSMEFVAGEDLSTSLRRIGRFPEDKATEMARQLCAGLAAAHERGVIHRDLKPANVMLDDAGQVRLMDFGLAAAGAVDSVRAGTPAYMAPEQLLGREVTPRSDIYALGLVLYELFTGRRVFSATTLNELIEQHQSGRVTPPSEIVTTIDPTIERAILRCLDSDPARRPSTALALSAALPGGDPLAAALAAGETPSPEIVAAAGEGAGLSRRVAVAVFAAILLGVAASYVMALRASPLEALRPEYNGDVLAQKARDAIRQIGYADRPRDEVYWFDWDESLIDFSRDSRNGLAWRGRLSQRPSPLVFRYRRSPFPMIGLQFHHDLLTPGIVDSVDPPPIYSNQIQLTLDHQGFLTAFEAIPPQVQPATGQPPAVDWTMLLKAAGLDTVSLQPAMPEWHWLAEADARVAWTGTWPDTTLPLRIEGASLGGRPVAFQVIGPWTKPSRGAGP
jgi:Protein kinase domain/zinc-ribbon domain